MHFNVATKKKKIKGRYDVTEKAKPCDSLATTLVSGGTHEVSRCLGLACLYCNSRAFQMPNRILHLSTGHESQTIWGCFILKHSPWIMQAAT